MSQLLSLTKWQFMVFGITPIPKERLPSALRDFQLLLNRIHVAFLVFSLITYQCSTLCFVLFKATTFFEYIEGTFFFAGVTLHVSAYISLFLKRSDLVALITVLEGMVERRSTQPNKRTIYEVQNEKARKFATMLWNIFFTFVQIHIVPGILTPFFKYYTSNCSTGCFQLALPVAIIWNWKTIGGYFYLAIVQYVWVHAVLVIAVNLSFYVGFCHLFVAFALDIEESMTDLRKSVLGTDVNLRLNRPEYIEQLVNTMKFHSDVKRLIERFHDAYGSIILIFFGLSTLFLCTSLVGLNSAVKMRDFNVIARLLVCASLAMIYVLVFCLYGNQVTTEFETANAAIYDCSWKEYPLEMQKLLRMMLMIFQKPVFIRGHMNIQFTREVLKRVPVQKFFN